MWGFAWRRNRQFVGRVCYGVKYLLWQPAQNIHEQFPESFRNAVDVMLMGACLLAFCLESSFFFSVLFLMWWLILLPVQPLRPRKENLFLSVTCYLKHVTNVAFYFPRLSQS